MLSNHEALESVFIRFLPKFKFREKYRGGLKLLLVGVVWLPNPKKR